MDVVAAPAVVAVQEAAVAAAAVAATAVAEEAEEAAAPAGREGFPALAGGSTGARRVLRRRAMLPPTSR